MYNKCNDERSKKKVSFSFLASYYTRVILQGIKESFFCGPNEPLFEEDGPKYRNTLKIFKSKVVL